LSLPCSIDKDLDVTHYDRVALQDLDTIDIGQHSRSVGTSKSYWMQFHFTRAGRRDSQYTLETAHQRQESSQRKGLTSTTLAQSQRARKQTLPPNQAGLNTISN
ncbi:hypothetical protein chiPu_0025883, partial [Chiloscyllium punctatum]|nr:hypothetical protein [Chiloscyllium punctatum]